MNSVNDSFDTASKVNLLEHQQSSSPSPTQRRNRNIIKVFFCLVIFLAVITGSILVYLIHKNNVNSQIQFNSQRTNDAVHVFCSMTLHMPECITSLSSSIFINGRKKINPDEIFSFSLMLANNKLNTLASLTKSLILISTDQSRSVSALRNCASLIDDSLHKLNSSSSASAGFSLFRRDMKIVGQENIRDIREWINNSLGDLKSCFDLLVKDDSRAVDELRVKVQKAMVYASNNLDFLQNRNGIVDLIETLNDQYSETFVDYEYLSVLWMFCPQFLVLILLYFLLLRKY